MTVRLAGGLAGLVCGAALAQPPAVPTPAAPTPAPPVAKDWSAVVKPSTAKPTDGTTALPKALADARKALATVRDYTTTMTRQERVGGALLPEQSCHLTARTQPLALAIIVHSPKSQAGQWTSYHSTRSSLVRHRSPSSPITRTLPADDPSVLMAARHPVSGYGLEAVLDRVDALLSTQKLQRQPTEVLFGQTTVAGKPAVRFELFTDRPTADGPRRVVLCLDAASKLPVRYEAFGPTTAAAPNGVLLEAVSFGNTRLNVGVGDAAFDR